MVLADLATGVIGPVIENGQNQTARMSDVGRAMDAAHAVGIEVILKPQLAVRDPAFDQYSTAFLADLADGAVFGVDLVGVYSRPQFAV